MIRLQKLVKTFVAKDIQVLDNDINAWLRERRYVSIIDVKFTANQCQVCSQILYESNDY